MRSPRRVHATARRVLTACAYGLGYAVRAGHDRAADDDPCGGATCVGGAGAGVARLPRRGRPWERTQRPGMRGPGGGVLLVRLPVDPTQARRGFAEGEYQGVR